MAIIALVGGLQIGGNGFIAVFVAGMAISVYTGSIGETMRDFGETEGQLLSLTTFLLFGLSSLSNSVPFVPIRRGIL